MSDTIAIIAGRKFECISFDKSTGEMDIIIDSSLGDFEFIKLLGLRFYMVVMDDKKVIFDNVVFIHTSIDRGDNCSITFKNPNNF